jgi:hypothetical protein
MEFRANGSGAKHSSESEKVVTEPVASVARPTASTFRRPEPKKSKRKIPALIAGLAIVLIIILGVYWFMLRGTSTPYINGGKYQAVFLSNSQVYFGKLQAVNHDYMRLTKVFYLQSKTTGTKDTKDPQNASSATTDNVELVKLGREIHGPNDEMIIARDQVLFYENLTDDSTVTKSIAKYYAKPQ